MRLRCPYCGERDLREFTCRGGAEALARPESGAPIADWDAYLHLRANPAGRTRDLFHHGPCGTWVVVERDRSTHEIFACTAASEVER